MRFKLFVYKVKKFIKPSFNNRTNVCRQSKKENLKENDIRKLAHNFLDNFVLENEQLTEAIFS